MHSSRMRTDRLLMYPGAGGVFAWGRGFLHQGGLLGACIQGEVGWADPPPREQNDTGVKTLPCNKLRLRAVITVTQEGMAAADDLDI